MAYKDQLSPWCIIRHLPKLQRLVVCRHRRRNDAEDHLQLLQRMIPHASYSIIFDPTLDSPDVTVNSKQPLEDVSPLVN